MLPKHRRGEIDSGWIKTQTDCEETLPGAPPEAEAAEGDAVEVCLA